MISVIIPTYNRDSLIPRAITSVLRQTYQDTEIIVVDDGSTDNTEEVVSYLLRDNDTYFKIPVNTGNSGKPRKIAVSLAKGEYICLLDSDDWLDESCLEKEYAVIVNNSDIGLVYSGNIDVSEKGKVVKKRHRHERGWVFKESLGHCVCSTTGVLIRRECFEELMSKQAFPLHVELFFLIAMKYKFDYVDEYLSYCYKYKGNHSFYTDNGKYLIDMIERYKKYYDRYPESRLQLYKSIAYYCRLNGNFVGLFRYSRLYTKKPIDILLTVLLLINPHLPNSLEPLYLSVYRFLPRWFKW